MRYTSLFVLLLLAGTAGCGDSGPGFDVEAHRAEVEAWRQGRLERLTSPTGFLSLAGLFWIEEGSYSFGSAPDSDFVFPPTAPAIIGEFELTNNGVFMRVEEGVELLAGGEPAESMLIRHDTTGEADVISLGSMSWYAIERAGNFGIRLRDANNPVITSFPPLEYFPTDPRWRVEGSLQLYDEPKVMNVDTVIEGLGYHPTSPGVVEFEFEGERYSIEAYESGDQFFFVFGDATTGKETYPAGRFLYSDLPDENGMTILDFNKAYSPPCAFNAFATCPVASPRNRLSVRIEAGELFDPAAHFVPEGKH